MESSEPAWPVGHPGTGGYGAEGYSLGRPDVGDLSVRDLGAGSSSGEP